MAEGSEYFPVGSVVACDLYSSTHLEGEVLAFDPLTRMLILRCPASNGKGNTNDIHMVNLKFATNACVKTEANSSPPPLPVLNFHRLTRRYELNIEEKTRMVKAMAAGVSTEGQLLFLAISKTFQDVCWQGDSIVVLNQVTISPPYRPENCRSSKGEDQAVTHIRKIVEKHLKEQQLQFQEETRVGPTANDVAE
ncbi:hypothetical protein CHUAL_002916 [Chamberlinius hualienensis]